MPFHPLLAWLLPWVPLALVVWGALSDDVSPWALLVTAAVLGVLMSVPILFYALMVFRVPLVQGALVAGAVVLVAVDVAARRLAWVWGLLPVLYVAVLLVQVVGGRVASGRQRRRNEAVVPVDPPYGLVEVTGPGRFDVVGWLLADSAVTLVCVDSSTWMRVDPESLARLAPMINQVRSGYAIEGGWLKSPGSESSAVTVRTEIPPQSAWRLVTGDRLRVWDVEEGEHRQRLVSGTAEIVRPLPLFVCFYFVALFGGRSRWVVGFPRRRTDDLGDGKDVVLRAFPPRPEPPTYADPSGPLAVLGALVAEHRQRYLAALDDLERTPDRELARRQLPGLHAVTAEATAGTGARLCDLVDRAKALSSQPLAQAAAQALARIPGDELRQLGPRVLNITGSRILSLQWELTPELDVSPLPRDLPRFGDVAGFGLLTTVPDLYRRLGELDDPRVLILLDGLAAEAGWGPALTTARETYLTRHPS